MLHAFLIEEALMLEKFISILLFLQPQVLLLFEF